MLTILIIAWTGCLATSMAQSTSSAGMCSPRHHLTSDLKCPLDYAYLGLLGCYSAKVGRTWFSADIVDVDRASVPDRLRSMSAASVRAFDFQDVQTLQ